MDNFATKVIAVAALLAGGGVFYHYVIYVPALHKAEIQDEQQRKAEYQACLADADTTYIANWESSCRTKGERAQSALMACMTLIGQSHPKACEAIYVRDISSGTGKHCTLPHDDATVVENWHKEAYSQCESKLRVISSQRQ